MTIGVFFAVFAGLILFTLIFGKRKEFEFEAKLIPEGSNNIVGEVEIEKYKNESPFGELDIFSNDIPIQGVVEIYHDENLVSRFQVDKQSKGTKLLFPVDSDPNAKAENKKVTRMGRTFRFPVSSDIQIINNDKARVTISGQPHLFGVFLRD